MRRARSENENNYKTNHTCNAAHGNAFHIIIALFGQNTLPARSTESGKNQDICFDETENRQQKYVKIHNSAGPTI